MTVDKTRRSKRGGLQVLELALLLACRLLGPASAAASDGLAPPDYATADAWAAFPGRPSRADDTPPGLMRAPSPTVPVFFIHPTTYLASVIGNAAYAPGGEIQSRVDEAVMGFQASVFNGCCVIFAPRYRQASLRAITTNTPQAYAADELAYGDVDRAFIEFLRLNPSGPFILAAHSQGSIHGLRLLQQRIMGKPLQQRLVAAYLIGLSLPREIAELGVPVCHDALAVGCVISWNSVRRGHDDRRREEASVIWWQGSYQAISGRPLVCVNPLDWQPGGSAPASVNKGSLYSAGRAQPLPGLIASLTGAWCEGDLLGVDIPFAERRHFRDPLSIFGVYHDFDYGLFYANIRENAAARVQAWQSHPSAAFKGPSQGSK